MSFVEGLALIGVFFILALTGNGLYVVLAELYGFELDEKFWTKEGST